ncbi:MAG TPA: hypothetical protein DC047_09575 [Blastocatellia bacterium]|nr:hypothetical protein [Blastocatellia bacterium]
MTEVANYSILFAVVGLVLIGISIPLILRKVPPNSFYGCRTRKTLSDPNIWYEANHVSGIDFCLAGLIVFVSSLAMLALGQNVDASHAVAALLIILLSSVVAAVWHGLIMIKRM